jgi:hypothetical protein
MSKQKVDLTLLKRLVSELDAMLATADGMSTDVKADKNEWVLELSKATGVAAGILTEAGLLMGDIQHLMAGTAAGAPKGDLLEKLMAGLKGPGNAN